MYFVYILQSEIDGSFYIGFTKNVQVRLKKHNAANTGYTARKNPWVLKYLEEFQFKSDALKREKFLKRQKNRKFYQRLIDEPPSSSVGE